MKTMFKKVLSVLFVVVLLQVGVIGAFAVDECEHMNTYVYDWEEIVLDTPEPEEICVRFIHTDFVRCDDCGADWEESTLWEYVHTPEYVVEELGGGKYVEKYMCLGCGTVYSERYWEMWSLED